MARAFWDYYKIMGYIPIDGGSDEELDEKGRPKSAANNVRSFNLLRLREIASQREETAKEFNGDTDEELNDDTLLKQRFQKKKSFIEINRKRSSGSYASSLRSESSASLDPKFTLDPVPQRRNEESLGEDGDVSESDDDDHEKGAGFGPVITPAPRVTFQDDVSIKRYPRNAR